LDKETASEDTLATNIQSIDPAQSKNITRAKPVFQVQSPKATMGFTHCDGADDARGKNESVDQTAPKPGDQHR
jgi:nucleosome binding factor SPN SPT16 subunit